MSTEVDASVMEAASQVKNQAYEKAKAKAVETQAAAAEAQAAADALSPTKPGTTPLALTSSRASLRAASMLAQICERASMEHQLAARHFTFYSFCEHAPVLRVCVMSVRVCPLEPRSSCAAESDRAIVLRRGVLRPVELYHRCHVHPGVHRRRL